MSSLDRGFGAAPNKAIPQNKRFANTQSRLNTGNNVRKILEAQQGSGPNAHKKHRDEFFVRLKPTTLGRLLEPLVDSEESIYHLGQEDTQSVVSTVPDSAGAGGGGAEGNILIFDLRPFEEFEQCHVFGATHLDPTILKRSTNNLPREVFFYKGPVECDKMVVLYDEDGKSTTAVGNAFVEQHGVENTYVVTGGFLALCATSPHVLVGHPPSAHTLETLLARAGIKVPTGGASARSDGGAPSARCSTAGSVRTQSTHLTSIAGGAGKPRAWK